ncbi:10672_t:CDS:1, partial [Cetraspora pellucida]
MPITPFQPSLLSSQNIVSLFSFTTTNYFMSPSFTKQLLGPEHFTLPGSSITTTAMQPSPLMNQNNFFVSSLTISNFSFYASPN